MLKVSDSLCLDKERCGMYTAWGSNCYKSYNREVIRDTVNNEQPVRLHRTRGVSDDTTWRAGLAFPLLSEHKKK